MLKINIEDQMKKASALTNKAQAICLFLAGDHLIQEECRKHYEKANECMIRAMRSLPHKS